MGKFYINLIFLKKSRDETMFQYNELDPNFVNTWTSVFIWDVLKKKLEWNIPKILTVNFTLGIKSILFSTLYIFVSKLSTINVYSFYN